MICPICRLDHFPHVTREGEFFADTYEVEYVESPSGDVYASALVSSRGDVLRVIDDDGVDLWPAMSCAERRRVADLVLTMRELRRAEAA